MPTNTTPQSPHLTAAPRMGTKSSFRPTNTPKAPTTQKHVRFALPTERNPTPLRRPGSAYTRRRGPRPMTAKKARHIAEAKRLNELAAWSRLTRTTTSTTTFTSTTTTTTAPVATATAATTRSRSSTELEKENKSGKESTKTTRFSCENHEWEVREYSVKKSMVGKVASRISAFVVGVKDVVRGERRVGGKAGGGGGSVFWGA